MWIRSQDRKTLVNLNDLWINNLMILSGDFCTLGKYKTEERALEVLDNIQSFIIENRGIDKSHCTDLVTDIATVEAYAVYQMPKE